MNKNKIFAFAALAIIGSVTALGGSMVNALQTDAQDITTAQVNTNTSANPAPPAFDETRGGHVGTNGKKEELLTGDTAEKVKVAALSANPGGTVQRVETDAEGSAYEAHMTKSDGTRLTVKFDSNFQITDTESGAR